MTVEYRFAELRADALDGSVLRGTAMPYGTVAQLRDFRERFEPGAFGAAVAEQDIRLDVGHVRTEIIARTGGGGLTLEDTDAALVLRADLVETQRAKDVLAYVRAGVYRGLSVEFSCLRDCMERDGAGSIRVVQRARLLAVSVVDSGAYPQAGVAARYAPDEVIQRCRDADLRGRVAPDVFRPWEL